MRSKLSFVALLAVSGPLPFVQVGCGEPGPPPPAVRTGAGARPVVRAKAPESPPAEFRLPDDKGGQLVSRLLAPPARLPAERTNAPRSRRVPNAVASPTLPPAAQVGTLPRLAPERRRPTPGPFLLAPEPPLGGHGTAGSVPEAPSFPAGERVRVASPDVEEPVALRPMAQPLPDRASLADPTTAASGEAALAAPLPSRTKPAAYQRFAVPDPFEHRDAVRLRRPPGEEPLPAAVTSRPRP